MQCLSPHCLMASAPAPDSSHLPALEVEMERRWVKGKEMPQVPHESEISSYKLCTTITSFTTVCQPGIEFWVVYSRKMCFSVLVWWRGDWGLCIYSHAFFFLPVDCILSAAFSRGCEQSLWCEEI